MTASYAVGDIVSVRNLVALGHIRAPVYVRGKTGVIDSVVGVFDNPEELAWGRPGDRRTLYRVRFMSTELFPDAPASNDSVDVEIYEHWLEKP